MGDKMNKNIDYINRIKESLLEKKEKNSKNLFLGKYDLSVLTQREEEYFRQMIPKSGVIYIKGEPGKAKTAILESIAGKLNLYYIDLRLSQIDETDVGLYPDKVEGEIDVIGLDGEIIKRKQNFLTHIIPEWAEIANNPQSIDKNYVGTLIVFEELNRAPLSVRNAALQLLLERRIGFRGFEFNENVFMASTGNLGVEDGTDVDEFDAALKDRLIPIKHEMERLEWVETWASHDLNIHSSIIDYLQVNPDQYYIRPSSEKKDDRYPTPRSWTFLSDMMKENFGIRNEKGEIIAEPEINRELIQFVMRVASRYIGSASTTFWNFLRDTKRLTIDDVLGRNGGKGYSKFNKDEIDFCKDRSKSSELLNKFNNIDINDLDEEHQENLKLFILSLNMEERVSFYLKVMDKDYDDIENEEGKPAVISILQDPRFLKILDKIEESVFNAN
jgi:hypothetical protein